MEDEIKAYEAQRDAVGQSPKSTVVGSETASSVGAGHGQHSQHLSDTASHRRQHEIYEASKETLGSRSINDSDDEVRDLGLREVPPVDILVRNLSVKIDLKPIALSALANTFRRNKPARSERFKIVLDDVDAYMPRGSITAVIGASGSGKTSFLNALARRTADVRIIESGSVLYGGRPRLSSVKSAYVMQQDVLLPALTVRETLRYSAELRLPPPTTPEERAAVVEEVILELGLKECADTRVGNDEHKGCSGGEKRRTSLGVQLLANPSVLFLDEVTTGLDAASAHQLLRTLAQLARKGRTIVTTIHQPRSEIWSLFDHIVLLSGGSPLYSGPAQRAAAHFANLGYPVPSFVNPAEHLIDIVAVDNRSPELEKTSRARVDALKAAWRETPFERTAEQKVEEAGVEHVTQDNVLRQTGFFRQVRVQTSRTFKVTWRDSMGMSGSLIESVLLSIITGWMFYDISGSLSGIRARLGALYTASAMQGYLILLFELYRLTLDIQVFDRERAEGVVGVWSFLVSRRLARFWTEDLPVPLIYSVIFYFMTGLQRDIDQFFVFFAVVLLGQFLAVTFAMLCIAISREFAAASLIANLNYTAQTMCSGFFVTSNQIPVWVRWIKYTAYVWYANGALVTNEFIGNSGDPAGTLYDCPYPGGTSNPTCMQWTGRFVVESQGIPQEDWIWRPMVILLAMVVAFFIGSGLIFELYRVDTRIARTQTSSVDKSTGKERLEARSLDRARTLDINLDRFALNIDKRNFLGQKTKSIPILNPISISFKPGIPNVIMGVSGGGKTSLLNMMANRLHDDFTTRYRCSGVMRFGGSIPSPEVTKSVLSYVCQSDDALMPSLTVREALFFAAQLRLPAWMSTVEKQNRAEEVLLKLGLKDCADTLIGNEIIKGISGGEKRRVSIAIQILTDPRILLLDEPTSGLDGFTASSIMDVLRGLAAEGRTVVLTIHQSRSDLFPHFGNVLLLARGGYPVYAGPGDQMLAHFSRLGHPCPSNANPADFALDLISVSLRSERKETATREKLRSLIESWDEKRNVAGKLSRSESHLSQPAELGSFRRKPTPYWRAATLLIRRSTLSFRRDGNAILARTWQVLGFGIIVTLFFAPLQDDYSSVQTRMGFVQEITGLYFVGMLQNVAVYPGEKRVFYNEQADGAYGVEAFFTAYTLLELPFEIVSCLLFSCLFSLAAGLPRTGTVYLAVAFNAFAIVNCGESVGMMFNTLFASTGFAVNLTSVVLSLGIIMSGVLTTELSAFLDAWNHISPNKWSVQNTAPYTFRGLTFTCEDAQRAPDGACPVDTGEQALDLYNLNVNPDKSIALLALLVVAYRLAAYLLLKSTRTRWRWPWRKAEG